MAAKKVKVSNVPNLRFPGFEGEEHNPYKKYFFKDIFLFSTGRNIKQDQASPEFEIPCVRYGELYYMYSEVINEVINRTNLDKSELLFSKGDEVLLPSAGEDPLDIGLASALTIENVAIGRTINILRPINANVYSQIYVSYYINQKLRKKISTLAKGSSISNVYNSDLKTLEIVLPNLDEQTKIASFLSLIDARIQTQSKIIQRLETSIRIFRQKLFTQKNRFKNINGTDFPEWEEKKLKEISSKQIQKNNDFKVKSVLTNSAVSGIINQRDFFDKDIANDNNINGYYVVEKDDFVYNPRISNEAPVGPISRNTIGIGIMSPLYMVFRFNEINLDFIEQFYKSTIWHLHMESIANYGARADRMSFSSNDFFKMPLLLPSRKEQEAIANFLCSIENKIKTEKRILKQYEIQKKHLLQNVFI